MKKVGRLGYLTELKTCFPYPCPFTCWRFPISGGDPTFPGCAQASPVTLSLPSPLGGYAEAVTSPGCLSVPSCCITTAVSSPSRTSDREDRKSTANSFIKTNCTGIAALNNILARGYPTETGCSAITPLQLLGYGQAGTGSALGASA